MTVLHCRPLPLELGGIRTLVVVPMLKESELVGAIGIYRREVRPFTDKQIELWYRTLLRRPSSPSRTPGCSMSCGKHRRLSQQQTATADVLKVISRSTFDLQTVLDTLVELAARLCDADMAFLFRCERRHLSLGRRLWLLR